MYVAVCKKCFPKYKTEKEFAEKIKTERKKHPHPYIRPVYDLNKSYKCKKCGSEMEIKEIWGKKKT